MDNLLTLKQIADKLELSKQRVHQLFAAYGVKSATPGPKRLSAAKIQEAIAAHFAQRRALIDAEQARWEDRLLQSGLFDGATDADTTTA